MLNDQTFSTVLWQCAKSVEITRGRRARVDRMRLGIFGWQRRLSVDQSHKCGATARTRTQFNPVEQLT
ncbi:hypothetical protein MES4922_120138 [Mesorhizobium ventifaucium]|uniref:Uncharacterized protein n=1 Tax=Mesorhizobium ventifaucium TaxID=666020 RepID=A0ABN8JE84_9HYPH|nr:hypothetical protein MES4922_120138 [Mesorhizobium ventifaucium]